MAKRGESKILSEKFQFLGHFKECTHPDRKKNAAIREDLCITISFYFSIIFFPHHQSI
jgi:hypothetical protein